MEKSIVDTSQVVLVDLNDRPTGYMEKQEAHRQGRQMQLFRTILNAGKSYVLWFLGTEIKMCIRDR